jgi:excisionase family DNA binding protein
MDDELNDAALEKIIQGVTAALRTLEPQRFYTPPQVAKLLVVKPDKVLTWIRSGELPAINVATDRKLGKRPRYRIDPTALESFKLRRAITPPRKASRSRKIETGVPSYF